MDLAHEVERIVGEGAVGEWKAKRDRKKLDKRAERTRNYADDCIAVALCSIEEAEVAILEAIAARKDADVDHPGYIFYEFLNNEMI